MKIDKLEKGDVFMDWEAMRIVTLHGPHVCYIDIPRDAIVYTTVDRIRNDTWELIHTLRERDEKVSGEEKNPEIEELSDGIYISTDTNEEAVMSQVFAQETKKRRGRPPGSRNK